MVGRPDDARPDDASPDDARLDGACPGNAGDGSLDAERPGQDCHRAGRGAVPHRSAGGALGRR
ncbi:hypothetical protein FRAAL4937 [Frankia alni ACN14a]|uniref:Uncharacterized protein n=1 Tax=Frankia alni (strain DSM 45986 / CECT 9034 / ACN14a) TaxID=326424 RepID=Q0RG11_FRAAA|nr:hypothetical protein FRAAL4937 [Frankia alni ACN14a]